MKSSHLDLQATLLLVLSGRYTGDVEAVCAVKGHHGHHQDRYRSGDGHTCIPERSTTSDQLLETGSTLRYSTCGTLNISGWYRIFRLFGNKNMQLQQ